MVTKNKKNNYRDEKSWPHNSHKCLIRGEMCVARWVARLTTIFPQVGQGWLGSRLVLTLFTSGFAIFLRNIASLNPFMSSSIPISSSILHKSARLSLTWEEGCLSKWCWTRFSLLAKICPHSFSQQQYNFCPAVVWSVRWRRMERL